MELLNKLEIIKQKGYTYNPETGEITSPNGYIIKGKNTMGYIQVNTTYNNKIIGVNAHQFAWYYETGEIPNIIDHINRIKDDNRFENLRNVGYYENAYNRGTTKGYRYCPLRKKVYSSITVKGNHIWLGYFETEQEALKAYLDAKEIYHAVDFDIANLPPKRKIKGYCFDKKRNKFNVLVKGEYYGTFENEKDAKKLADRILKQSE